jgi:methylamine utilization protein MauE
VLASASLAKVLDARRWTDALRAYRIAWLTKPGVAWAVPVLESGAAFTLAASAEPAAALATCALFTSFAAALAAATTRGARAPCECFGAIFRTEIGPWATTRALVLAAAALSLVGLPRPIGHLSVSGPLVVAFAAGVQLLSAMRELGGAAD